MRAPRLLVRVLAALATIASVSPMLFARAATVPSSSFELASRRRSIARFSCSQLNESISPCTASVSASPNSTGTKTYSLTNNTIEDDDFGLSCRVSGVVTSCSVRSDLLVRTHSSGSFTLSYHTSSSAGTGTVTVTASGIATLTATLTVSTGSGVGVRVTPKGQAVNTQGLKTITQTYYVKNVGTVVSSDTLSAACSGTATQCQVTSSTPVSLAVGDSAAATVSYLTSGLNSAGTVSLIARTAGVADTGSVNETVTTSGGIAMSPHGAAESVAMWTTSSRQVVITNTGNISSVYRVALSCTGVVSPCLLSHAADSLVAVSTGHADTVYVIYAAGPNGTPLHVAAIGTDTGNSAIRDSAWSEVTVQTLCSDQSATMNPCTASTTALTNRSGLSLSFGIRNNQTIEGQSFNATVHCDGRIIYCSLDPQTHVGSRGTPSVPPGQATVVTVYYATDTLAGPGGIYLTAGDATGTIGGTESIAVTVPPKMPLPQLFTLAPHFATRQLDPAQSTSQVFQLLQRGSDTATYVVTATCSAHGALAGGCTPATSSVLLQPGSATSLTISFTAASAAGPLDTLLVRGWRAADTTVRDSGTVVLSVARGAGVVDVASVNPGDVLEPSLCVNVSAGAGVSYECDDARLAYGLPSTRTRNRARAPTLLYSSRLALPYVIIGANVTLPNDGRVPETVTGRLLDSVGVKLDSAQWSGTDWVAGSTRRIALQFDPIATRNYPTGSHRYTLEVTRSYADTTVRDTASGTFFVVRRDDSQFGRGWWLAGLERLFRATSRAVLYWVGGDGSARVYSRSATDTSVWLAPKLDHPDSVRLVGDRYVRYLPHGLRVQFDTAYGCHLETINRLGDTTRFHYADPGCGRLDTLYLPPSAAAKKYVFSYANHSPGVWWLSEIDAPPVGGHARAVMLARNTYGQVSSITDPAGHSIAFVSRASNDDRITQRIDERGDTVTISYASASAGSVAQIVAPVAQDTTAITAFVAAATRGLQGSAAVSLDAVYTKVDGPRTDVGDSTLFWVDRFGAPSRVRNAVGDETIVTRDVTWPALAANVHYPNGQTLAATYDGHGNLLTTTDSSTFTSNPTKYATTQYTWDGTWDFVTSITRPEGDVVSMAYDPVTGNRTWQQDGDAASRVTFDYYSTGVMQNLLRNVHYPLGATDSVAYESVLGNLSASVSAMGDTVTYAQDDIGRDVTVTQPSDSTVGFRVRTSYKDLLDQDTLIVESAGAQALYVRQHFDPAGNLDTLARWSVPDPNGIDTVTRAFRYDRSNRKIWEMPVVPWDSTALCPAVQPVTWSYDLAGNVLDGGTRPTINAYDVLNRRVRAIGGDTAVFAYDPIGNLLEADNAAARISRSYYPNGALRADTLRIATATLADSNFAVHVYELGYGYDLDGRRTWMADQVQDTTRYGYDPASGQLASITDVLGNRYNFHYDARRQLFELTRLAQRADSITEVYVYDDDGRLVKRSIQSPGYGQPIHDDSLVYDRAGRVVGNPKVGDGTSYSAFGALKSASYVTNDGSESFQTDALGNKVSSISYGTQYQQSNYQYIKGSDRLKLATHPPTFPGDSTYYCTDSDGAMGEELTVHPYPVGFTTARERRDIVNTYNRQRQLIKSAFTLDTTPPPGPYQYRPFHTTESYRYDALGRRVWVRMLRDTTTTCTRTNGCPNQVTRTVWDGSTILREIRAPGDTVGSGQENDNAGGTYYGSVTYLNGPEIDKPLELIKGSGIQLYTNWRGQIDFGTCGTVLCSSTVITFPAARAGSYGGFGAAPDSAVRPWNGTLILGMTDGSGYQYRRNRYYDPQTGRFTQEDPIGLAGGLNVYGYADGDPVTYSDPFGLCPCNFDEVARQTGALVSPAKLPLEIAGTIVVAPLAGGMGMLGGISSEALTIGAAFRAAGTRLAERAAQAVEEVLESGTIWRAGGANPSNLTIREGEEALSARNTLSNPLGTGEGPVFRAGGKATEIDVAKLPKGSAVLDNTPPGHVSIRATAEQIKAAVVRTITLPKQ